MTMSVRQASKRENRRGVRKHLYRALREFRTVISPRMMKVQATQARALCLRIFRNQLGF